VFFVIGDPSASGHAAILAGADAKTSNQPAVALAKLPPASARGALRRSGFSFAARRPALGDGARG